MADAGAEGQHSDLTERMPRVEEEFQAHGWQINALTEGLAIGDVMLVAEHPGAGDVATNLAFVSELLITRPAMTGVAVQYNLGQRDYEEGARADSAISMVFDGPEVHFDSFKQWLFETSDHYPRPPFSPVAEE